MRGSHLRVVAAGPVAEVQAQAALVLDTGMQTLGADLSGDRRRAARANPVATHSVDGVPQDGAHSGARGHAPGNGAHRCSAGVGWGVAVPARVPWRVRGPLLELWGEFATGWHALLLLQKLSGNHDWSKLGPKTGSRLWPAALLPQLVHLLGGEVLVTGLLGRQVGGIPIPFRVVAGSNADPGLARGRGVHGFPRVHING